MKKKVPKFPYLLTRGFLYLALSLYLLYAGSGGYGSIQTAKFSLFIILFGGYLALMALCTAELLVVGRLKLPPIKTVFRSSTPTQRAVVLFWLATTAATLLSSYRGEALLGMSRQEGLLTISIYCGVFLCVSVFGRMEKGMLLAFGGAMTVFSVIALLQMQGYNPLSLYPNGVNYFDADIKYAGSYLGTAGNAGLTAALLCMAIPLFWVTILRRKEKERLWLLLPLGLSLAALLQSKIQAGLLALLLGTLLTVPTVVSVAEGKRKKLYLAAAALLAAGLILVALIPVGSGTLYELQQILRGNWDGDFGTGRIRIWQEVLKQVPQHLLLGTGPDTMAAAQLLQSAEANGMVFFVDVAHNEYLNILYHQGVLGLLPYLAALVLSAVQWIKKSPGNGTVAALGAAVLCYGIQAFFSFSMCQSAGVFWILWALLERESRLTEEKKP